MKKHKGRNVRGSGMGLLVSQLTKLLVNIISVAAFSRVLSREEIGIAAIAVSIIGLSEILRDFGLSAVVIREPMISRKTQSNLFWVNNGIGLLLVGLAIIGSGLIEAFFKIPGLGHFILLVSPVFLVNALGGQHRADLNRTQQFWSITLVDMLSTTIGLTLGLVSAYALDLGLASIAIQHISTAIIAALVSIVLAGWLPRLYDRKSSIRPYLRLGGNIALSQILSYFGNNIDTFFLGKFSGVQAVAVYSRGFQTAVTPIQQLRNPANIYALPKLSIIRGDNGRYFRLLLRAQALFAFTLLPIAAVLAANSNEVVDIFLGPGWDPVKELMPPLILAATLQQLSSIASWTFTVYGWGEKLRTYSLISLIIKIIFIAATAPFGPLAVSWGYLASVLTLWPIALYMGLSPVSAHWKKALIAGALLTVPAITAFMVTDLLVSYFQPDLNPLFTVLLRSSVILLSYLPFFLIRTFRNTALQAYRDGLKILSI